MRLIDADNLIGLCNIMADKCDGIGESIWNQFAETVRWCPTIDAEPVRHGHFIFTHKPNIYGGITVKCSECGYEGVIAHIEDHHYCWVCGAKMDEVNEE